ncbi:hypothetical protein NS1_06 [Citrobacter phage NS1]|uniref:Uncharacterized protein n=1 Tax=Citrobacter phage NS1 TaxID=2766968 RepID=A0A7G9IRC0_9CAUD
MKFAHKHTGGNGGNRVVTVTTVAGKGLVKATMVPTGTAKQQSIPSKKRAYQVESSHEKALQEAETKGEPTK